MLIKLQFISNEQHSALQARCRAEKLTHRQVFKPGLLFYTPWVFDPSGERERNGEYVMIKHTDHSKLGYLSSHYWHDWSQQRPPLCVVCPNGSQWEIDRQASNGSGWQVVGELENLTAMPSIISGDYHGWLKNGEFSEDLDGKSWPELLR